MPTVRVVGVEGVTGRTLEELVDVNASLDALTQSLDTPYWPVQDPAPTVSKASVGVHAAGAAGTVTPNPTSTPDGVAATGAAGGVSVALVVFVTGDAGSGAVGVVIPGVTMLPVGVEGVGAAGPIARIIGAWSLVSASSETWTTTTPGADAWVKTAASSETWT